MAFMRNSAVFDQFSIISLLKTSLDFRGIANPLSITETIRKEAIFMKIGYARVSTTDQNLDRQIDALQRVGCEVIYEEKASGRARNRPELNRILATMQKGDQVVVVKLDRIGRNTKHLIELSERFDEAGVDFVSLGDSIDTSSATGRLFFAMLAAIAQFEADLIAERTRDGLAAARARGRVGGRPRTNPEVVERALKMYDTDSFTVREITSTTGMSRASLYRYLNARKE